MELFQKQIMQAKDKFLKKQINLIIFTVIFFIIFCSKSLTSEEVNSNIEKYFKNLNYFSSKFIQSNGTTLDEGFIYIKDNKIRLDYFNPERTLKISKKKGVYINHDLKEEEFFSAEKNIVKIFYDIFLDNKFFSSLLFEINNGEIVFEKNIQIESKNTNLKIFFENKPLLLRKIIAESQNEIILISFNEHSYNNVFDKDFFSFVPIYPD